MTTNEVKSPYSRAIMHRTISLNSTQAHHVMNRSFNKLKRSLFSLSVIMPIISDDEEEVETIDAYISEQFAIVESELAAEVGRFGKLIEDNGIDERAEYSSPVNFEVVLDTPKAGAFLRMVSDMDQLMALIDTAWLCGELDNKQKKNATFSWRQRLIKLAGRIIGIERRARVAADRQGKGDIVEENAPIDNSEIDTEMAEAAEEVPREAVLKAAS